MFLACKCHSATRIHRGDFVRCSDNIFTEDELDDTITLILDAFQCKLAFPTFYDLTNAFFANQDRPWMIEYPMMKALHSRVLFDSTPSYISACIVVLFRYAMEEGNERKLLWTRQEAEMTGYTFEELCDGVVNLSSSFQQILPLFQEGLFVDRVTPEHVAAFPIITSSAPLLACQAQRIRWASEEERGS